jgi:hypothetical protein
MFCLSQTRFYTFRNPTPSCLSLKEKNASISVKNFVIKVHTKMCMFRFKAGTIKKSITEVTDGHFGFS